MKETLFGTGLLLLVLNTALAVFSKIEIGGFKLPAIYGTNLLFWVSAAIVGLLIMLFSALQE